MAGPAQVEFPGQKKQQRLRMRGTKRASQNVQQRLRKNLDLLLENPEIALPEMRWEGRLPWGRIDPVTRTRRQIDKVLNKRHYISWLHKRMMSKRGDPMAKAWAGALAAAHETDISLVGTFTHPIYGNSSFVRKGDSKPIFAVGIQNHRNARLRLLSWESHARKGWYFFSWSDGFVCSGNKANIPDGWLEEVLDELDDDVEKTDVGFSIGNVEEGGVSLDYNNGITLVLGPEVFTDNRKSPLITELALSMMPPNLTKIAEGGFSWKPRGWPEDEPLPEKAVDEAETLIRGWMELGVPEGSLWQALQTAVTGNLGTGVAISGEWFSITDLAAGIRLLSGSDVEREAAGIGLEIMAANEVGATIGENGEFDERDDGMIWCKAKTCHHLLSALWEDFGEEILLKLGLEDVEVGSVWQSQLEKMSPFGKFLRGLESSRAAAALVQKFPWKDGVLSGICGEVHALILQAHGQGVGRAHAKAAKMRGDIAIQALGWAWLSAHNKGVGQEWHFEQDARDRGSGWSMALGELWEVSCALVEENDAVTKDDYIKAIQEFASVCGESGTISTP